MCCCLQSQLCARSILPFVVGVARVTFNRYLCSFYNRQYVLPIASTRLIAQAARKAPKSCKNALSDKQQDPVCIPWETQATLNGSINITEIGKILIEGLRFDMNWFRSVLWWLVRSPQSVKRTRLVYGSWGEGRRGFWSWVWRLKWRKRR